LADGSLELRVDEKNWRQIDNLAEVISSAFNAALVVGDRLADALDNNVGATIVLANNDRVMQLNDQWRSKPQPTNILSFPAPEGERDENGNRYLGDMILAFEVVARESEQQGKALATHLCHLVIHGALHLLGYDHLEDTEAEKMEKLEKRAMQALDLPDPYLPVSAEQEYAVK